MRQSRIVFGGLRIQTRNNITGRITPTPPQYLRVANDDDDNDGIPTTLGVRVRVRVVCVDFDDFDTLRDDRGGRDSGGVHLLLMSFPIIFTNKISKSTL